MAPVRRHGNRLLRSLVRVLVAVAALQVSTAWGQAPPAQGGATPLPAVSPQAAPPTERVIEIRIVGNKAIKREKVLSNIGTHEGQPFDQATFESDIRKLSSKNWFVHVHPRRERVPGGIVITLEVVERPTLQYVRYLGATKLAKTIAKETGLKVGDSLDPYAVDDGARKIESLYQTKGYSDVKVTVLEGNKPGDKGAIYLINEGRTQKIKWVSFQGNSTSIAPSGRLKTLIQSKPPILWLFKGHVDRKKIDEDVEKLTAYYRSLGFFQAHVGREYEFNEKENWMTLTFYINEGPRYKVRSISYIGNKIYPEDALVTDRKLKPGDYFDQSKMNSDLGIVKDIYGSNGFVFAEANADLRFFEEPGELDLVYKVTEGKQHRIGDINITIKGDNPHTRYSTILNRLSMRPGDIADIRQFRASERRLKASGLYNMDPSKGELPKIAFSPPDSEENIAGTAKKNRSTAKRHTGTSRGQSPDPVPQAPAQTIAVARPVTNNAAPPVNRVSAPEYPRYAPQVAAPAAATSAPRREQSRPQAAPQQAPAQPASTATVRGQSPDGTYGGVGSGYTNSSGYGGRAVAPTPYTVNQPPSYPSQPPTPPPVTGYAQPSAPPQGAAPGYPPMAAPPAVNPPGNYLPPPGEFVQGEPIESGPPLPIFINAAEAQTGKFMFGAGVNSNAGVIGSIILDEQNFDWRRVPSSWEDVRSGRAFRGAGQKFRIEAAPGTQVSRYLFNFSEPYLFDTPVGMNLSGYYFNRFYRDWTEQRVGGRGGLGYQFSPDLSGNVALRAEDIRISQPRVAGVPELDEVLGYTQLYTVKTQLAHDIRDSTFLPTEGHYFSIDFEYGFGTFQFPKFTTNFQKHFMMKSRPDGTGRHTLSYYTQFGITGSDTPLYERFYAGGFGTLRGFQFRGASPMVNTVEVGGDISFINSLEYMFPITADDMFKMVVFCDFGTVEQTPSSSWSDFRVAPGVGFRVTVPMISLAPIALDFAVPVNKNPNDLTQVFSFFVGLGH